MRIIRVIRCKHDFNDLNQCKSVCFLHCSGPDTEAWSVKVTSVRNSPHASLYAQGSGDCGLTCENSSAITLSFEAQTSASTTNAFDQNWFGAQFNSKQGDSICSSLKNTCTQPSSVLHVLHAPCAWYANILRALNNASHNAMWSYFSRAINETKVTSTVILTTWLILITMLIWDNYRTALIELNVNASCQSEDALSNYSGNSCYSLPLTENWVFTIVLLHYWHTIVLFDTVKAALTICIVKSTI